MVVLDEAYYEYVTDASYPASIKLMERYPNLVILRTFSKIYGLVPFASATASGNLRLSP